MYPYLAKFGIFELRIYSLAIMAAMIVAMLLTKRRSVQIGYDGRTVENFFIYVFFSSILGARIYYVLFNWKYYKYHLPEIPAVWNGGLAIHGGVVAGVIVSLILCRKYKFKAFQIGDIIAPSLLLGQGIGRIGNFTNGEAHGVPTIIPPEIVFTAKPMFQSFWNTMLADYNIKNTPEALSAFYNKIMLTPHYVQFGGKNYLLKDYVPWGISFPPKYRPQAWLEFGSMPVHPTFFYEMILNILGAFILFVLWKNDKNIGTGKIIGLYFIFYGFIRGFVTFFRADDLMLGAIRAPHAASIIFIITGIVWIYFGKRSKQNVL